MKPYNTLFLSVLICTISLSCNEVKKSDKKEVAKIEQKKELHKVTFKIEGMTCQIGCAKIIQSKLLKTKGIKTAHVSFDKGLGEFTFDANQISKTNIINKINSIGNGDTYHATPTNDL